jgi:hypothetical protein
MFAPLAGGPLEKDNPVGGLAQLLPQRHDPGAQLQQFLFVSLA